MKHTRFHFAHIVLVVPLVSYQGCTVKEPCDSDQVEVFGQCQDVPEEHGDGDGDPTGDGDGGSTGNSGGGADGQSDEDEDASPNFGATCSDHEDCIGGTVCGAPQLPQCIGLCGSGDPFEDACPTGTECVEAVPGTSLCMEASNEEEEQEEPNFDESCSEQVDCKGGTVCGAPDLPQCLGMCGPDDPFEDNCPDGKTCTEVQAGVSLCF